MKCKKCNGELLKIIGTCVLKYPNIKNKPEISFTIYACEKCGKLQCY